MDATVDFDEHHLAVGADESGVEATPSPPAAGAMLQHGPRQSVSPAEREELDLRQRLGTVGQVSQQPP